MGGRMSPFQPPRETWPEFERAAERSGKGCWLHGEKITQIITYWINGY